MKHSPPAQLPHFWRPRPLYLALVLGVVGAIFLTAARRVSGRPDETRPPLPLKVHVEAAAWQDATFRSLELWNKTAGGSVLQFAPEAEAQVIIEEAIEVTGDFELAYLQERPGQFQKIRIVFPVATSGPDRFRRVVRSLGLSLGLPSDRDPTSVMNPRIRSGLPWRILPQDQWALKARYGML